MAFCPHCGKSVTDQASKCLACGKEFEPRAKAARFKGTMMMSPAAAAPLAPKPAAEPPKDAPAPAAPAAPAAAAPAPAPKPAAPSKVAKHTMLGTGGLGLAPPQMAPRAPTPAPAAPVPQPPPAAGSLPPQAAAPAPAKPAAPRGNVWDADAAADTEPPPREDSGHVFADEPMGSRGAAQYGRESSDAAVPTQRTGKLLVVGITGVVVIAVLGYLAAKMMGLG